MASLGAKSELGADGERVFSVHSDEGNGSSLSDGFCFCLLGDREATDSLKHERLQVLDCSPARRNIFRIETYGVTCWTSSTRCACGRSKDSDPGVEG